jgi:hypothetical protein
MLKKYDRKQVVGFDKALNTGMKLCSTRTRKSESRIAIVVGIINLGVQVQRLVEICFKIYEMMSLIIIEGKTEKRKLIININDANAVALFKSDFTMVMR